MTDPMLGMLEHITAKIDQIAAFVDRVERPAGDVRDRGSATTRVAYSPEEVAEMLPISPNTVRSMVRDGRLKRIPNTGRKICIAVTELEDVFGITHGEDAT